MSEATLFNELRKWLASEMQDEAQASGQVNRSDSTRMRAMAKAVAYNRVIQKMDEIEAKFAKAEVESMPSIRDMWVAENGIEFDELPVDREIYRKSGLDKLTPQERKALGV